MTPKFIIIDWAGNVLFNGREFESFEDGWEFLYEHFAHVSDEELEDGFFDDYFVVQAKTRSARYLDPNDPRPKLKGVAS